MSLNIHTSVAPLLMFTSPWSGLLMCFQCHDIPLYRYVVAD